MSFHYMKALASGKKPEDCFEVRKFGKSLTKQSFMDECDINKILQRAQKTGTLSHLQKHGASYGDFTDMPDLLQAHERLAKGHAIFAELPSEIRAEFGQDASKFFTYVNDPANVDRLPDLLPALAQPGRQLLDVRTRAGDEPEAVESEAAPVNAESETAVEPAE